MKAIHNIYIYSQNKHFNQLSYE